MNEGIFSLQTFNIKLNTTFKTQSQINTFIHIGHNGVYPSLEFSFLEQHHINPCKNVETPNKNEAM